MCSIIIAYDDDDGENAATAIRIYVYINHVYFIIKPVCHPRTVTANPVRCRVCRCASLINNNYSQAARDSRTLSRDNDNNFPNRAVCPRPPPTLFSRPQRTVGQRRRTGNSGHDVFKNGGPLLPPTTKKNTLPPTAPVRYDRGGRRTQRNRRIFRPSNRGFGCR